jgi:hypothetical protein
MLFEKKKVKTKYNSMLNRDLALDPIRFVNYLFFMSIFSLHYFEIIDK